MKNKDLTVGSPAITLWHFTLPMVISVIFQQLYSIADSVIAGQCINADALAAVGASYPVTMIYMAVALGINIGCSVVISQLFGAKSYSKLKTATFTALIAATAVSLVLTAAGVVFTKPLITLLNTPENIYGDSAAYLEIYTFGLTFVFLYNICTGTFSALGDSVTPLIMLICSSVLNVVLDILFVTKLEMGVAGLAWATFIAQGVAALFALFMLIIRILNIESEKFAIFDFALLGLIAKIAVPGICQHSFVSVGNLFIQNLVNGYNSTVVAGYSAAIKLNSFAIAVFSTISNAYSSYTAQNMGAGRYDRVKDGFRASMLINFAFAVPFFIAFIAFGKYSMRIFVKAGESPDVIRVGRDFLLIVAPFYVSAILKLTCDAVLHGSASVREFMATTFLDLIIRVVLAVIFEKIFRTEKAIWASWPFGWTISALLSLWFYKNGRWKRRLVGSEQGTGFSN